MYIDIFTYLGYLKMYIKSLKGNQQLETTL